MNRIDTVFSQLDTEAAFVPYITAGHPGVDATPEIMRLLAENGSDIIELGYPFSDPTADGPVIQASSQQALEAGFRRDDYFRIIRRFREHDTTTPIVAFTYYNPVFHYGTEAFIDALHDAGADAMLLVDVPLEEQDEVMDLLQARVMHLIQLIAPTTPDERAREIVARAGGFVYQVGLKGVTGVRKSLADDALDNIARTRKLTDLPVCMGFGVSSGETAAAVARAAAGVVVGSALVNCITENSADYGPALTRLVQELADATHRPAQAGQT